jgi:hypothetical protein
MATYVIEIDRWRPALDNELIGCHPKTAGKRKKGTLEFIKIYGRIAGVTPAAGPRRVDLTLTYGARWTPCDPTAPWKSLLDALVNAKFLIGDRQGDYESSTTILREGTSKLPSTRIVLTDLY